MGHNSRIMSPMEQSGLRVSLDPKYRNLSNEELNDLVSAKLEGMTEDQAESFLSTLGDIGGKALPGIISGAAVGAAGGLPGMVAGAVVGGIGSALAGNKPAAPSPQVQPAAPSPQVQPKIQTLLSPTRRVPAVRSPTMSACAELLRFLQHPVLLQSLLSIMLGEEGSKMTQVSSIPVPTGDVMIS